MISTSDLPTERQALIEATRDWGYFSDSVNKLSAGLRGKRVLDIGMGAGPHAVVYVENGAANYVGVDPTVGSDAVRDFRSWADPSIPAYHAFPFSTHDIERLYPNVKLYPAVLEDVVSEVKKHRPNFAVMTSVTEHLRYPHHVIRSIWEVLDRDGLLWSNHQNYYSWTGHHHAPREVAAWDQANPTHNAVADWKHLEPTHPTYSDPNLNRIRLEDLRLIGAKYFELQSWDPVVDHSAVARLTPEIRRRWRKHSLAELLTRTIEVVGRRRDVPLDIDFGNRQFFHPNEDYLADRDYLHEDMTPYTLDNRVFFYKGTDVISHSTNNFAALRVFDRLKGGDPITLRKAAERYTFTVADVVRPADAAAFVRLTEPVPEPLQTTNYSEWTIEL